MTYTTSTISQDWIETLEESGFDPTCSLKTTPSETTERLAALVAIAEDHGVDPYTFCEWYQGEAEGYNDEEAGAAFAQDLATDMGLVPEAVWPANCIDWKSAWYELRIGDGYAVHQVPGTHCLWWVTRNI